jgi:hypothetical protein
MIYGRESTKLYARRHNFGLPAGTWEKFSGKNKEPIYNRRKATHAIQR